jgi:hypothetical protein
MDKFIEYYLNKNKSKSESTRTTLISAIRRIEKITKMKFDEWDDKTFNNFEAITDLLIEEYSLNTVILSILAIIRFLEYKNGNNKTIQEYKDILNELIQEKRKDEISQKQTIDEAQNWISYPELKKKVEDMAPEYLNHKKAFSKMRNFVILALFTLQPPTRIGNYLEMKIKEVNKRDINSLNKKYNYITKQNDKYKMIFNNYKTSKYIGKVEHIIENEILNQLLDKYINEYLKRENRLFKNDTLFINVDGKPMSQSNFTQAQESVTTDLLGKKLSTNDFRHIFLSWFLSTNPTIQEKEKIAFIIGQKYKPSRMELYQRRNENGDLVV